VIATNQEPQGPLRDEERVRAQSCLTGQQLIAYRRHRAGQSVSYAAAGMGLSCARFRHLVSNAQRKLGYAPTYAPKQRTGYRSTGRRPGRPRKPPTSRTGEVAELLGSWSAAFRESASMASDDALAQQYEQWAGLVDGWRRRGLTNVEELARFLGRRQAELRRERLRTRPYDYDGVAKVHRYDEDPVRREMREDGIEATPESDLDSELPSF
jgi:hypothetical protein